MHLYSGGPVNYGHYLRALGGQNIGYLRSSDHSDHIYEGSEVTPKLTRRTGGPVEWGNRQLRGVMMSSVKVLTSTLQWRKRVFA